MNKLDYELSVDVSEMRKEMAKLTPAKPGTSAETPRNRIRAATILNSRIKGECERKKADNYDKLSKRLADEANFRIDKDRKNYTKQLQDFTNGMNKQWFEEKKSIVMRNMSQIPTGEAHDILHFANNFGDMLDKNDWKMLISNPKVVANPFASRVMEKIASKYGIDCVSAPDLQKTLDRLSDYESMLENAVARIEDENDLVVMSVLSGYPDSPVLKLISEIDTDLATIIPDPKQTILQRLKDAEKKAEDAKDFSLYARIKVFRESNEKSLATPEEMKDELFSQAESLIAQGMSVKADK